MLSHAYILLVVSLLSFHKAFSCNPIDEEFRQIKEIIEAYNLDGLATAEKIVLKQDPKGLGKLDPGIDQLSKRFHPILDQNPEMAFPALKDFFNQYEECIKLNENKTSLITLNLNTLRQTILNLALSYGYLEELYNQAASQYKVEADKLKDKNPILANQLYKKQAYLMQRYLDKSRKPTDVHVIRYSGDAYLNIATCTIPFSTTEARDFCEKAVHYYDQFLKVSENKGTAEDYKHIAHSFKKAASILVTFHPKKASELYKKAGNLLHFHFSTSISDRQDIIDCYLNAANLIKEIDLYEAHHLESRAYELQKMLH